MTMLVPECKYFGILIAMVIIISWISGCLHIALIETCFLKPCLQLIERCCNHTVGTEQRKS